MGNKKEILSFLIATLEKSAECLENNVKAGSFAKGINFSKTLADVIIAIGKVKELQAEIEELRESNKTTLVGWVILDRDGIPYTFVPKSKSFYGQIIENDVPSQEYIQHLERDWSGLAPFTVKEIFT